jgi:hypothetical protein
MLCTFHLFLVAVKTSVRRGFSKRLFTRMLTVDLGGGFSEHRSFKICPYRIYQIAYPLLRKMLALTFSKV